MDLDRLHEFTVLAEQGSLKAAALSLGLSPAALSARIHAFEHSLNVPLVRMQGKTLGLTGEGQSLLIHARGILKAYRGMADGLLAASRHAYHRLRIALCETSLPFFLGPFLDRLNSTWPQMRIDLIDGSRMAIADSLFSGEADLFFALLMERDVPDGLIRYDIARPFQHVLLPGQHPLAQRTSIALSDLDGECFILFPGSGEACIRNFQLTNLAAAGIRYRTYDSGTDAVYAKLLVPIGKGVLLLPTPMPDLPPNTVGVAVQALPHPAVPCVFAARQSANPDVHAFMADYRAFCREAIGREARPRED